MSEIVEVALFTDDVEALKSFYRTLVGTAPTEEWPGGAIYAAGSVTLLMHERARRMEGGPANEDHFALGVGDVDAAYEELRHLGIAFEVEPRDYPWGRSAYLRDPEGRLVELIQV